MPDHLLIYDGDCAMCRRWMDRVRRWDTGNRIEALPLQSPEVAERVPGLEREALMRAMHFVEPDGTVTAGAAAAERMLRVLPRGGALGWIFRLPFARTVADRVYRWIADHRSRLGCGDHCTVEGPPKG